MRTLDEKHTAIFCRLLDRLANSEYLLMVNEPFMPLTIERVGDAYNKEALLISLCHYYKRDGDLMQDPEMCFVVVDHRNEESSDDVNVQVTPYSYKQADMGIYQESLVFENDIVTVCKHDLQHEHADFAEIWLSNIEAQRFLNV